MALVSSFYFLFFCRYLGQILLRRDSHAGIYIYIYRSVVVLCVLVEISLFDLIDFVSCL